MITDIHAKYYANLLTAKSASNKNDRLSNSLFDSALTLNPHQIDAALFVFKSPLSKGVLLADEVGLGKTIEAGLVMCQLWAERKRSQLVICPASLRKQWSLELLEKFNLDSIIMEQKSFNDFVAHGIINPFLQNSVIITSYNYAARMCREIAAVDFDIVIMDEAHKMRNSYRESNKMGQAIRIATAGKKKLLLTATPLQNSLLELYGIATMIDDKMFGDVKSFREQFVNNGDTDALKERLSHFCKRTLRRDVSEYIKYTERLPIVQKFVTCDIEQKLYDGLSEFLQREYTYAVPYRQRALTTLIVRKLMASSTCAVRQTIETILSRLIKIRDGEATIDSEIENIIDEDEALLLEESEEEMMETDEGAARVAELDYAKGIVNKAKLDKEIEELQSFVDLAVSIEKDTKSDALLDALNIGFAKMFEKGAYRKALIFTESRRTQEYLKSFLENNGYLGKVVLFNGSNSGEQVTKIYQDWLVKNKNTGRISSSRTADKRNAIIEYFRDTAEIMIATESAAEGVNLQFCSLVINYDLPWNPQRIEQRIGRCHRYGQKNDVVVMNFLNERNYADQRVYELLDQKLRLFNGVFGSSDDVLGSIESGVDFENRILSIYQKCRTPEEIDESFNALQKELEDKIQKTMKKAREKLFKNFDVDVHQRLSISVNGCLDKISRVFWALTKYELLGMATFSDEDKTFVLDRAIGDAYSGQYQLINKENEEQTLTSFLYRLTSPLGKYVINQALSHADTTGKVVFDITHNKGKLSQVNQLKGKSGYMTLYKYSINAFEDEDHLLFVGFTHDGEMLDNEQCEKLFECEGSYHKNMSLSSLYRKKLSEEMTVMEEGTLYRANERNISYLKEEEERLDNWTEDMVYALEKELTLIKRQIRELQRKARNSLSTEEHLEFQQQLSELERQKRNKRARLEENEDKIQEQRDILINDIKRRMKSTTTSQEIFTIEWEVI